MDRSRVEGLPVWMLTPKEEKEVFENWRNSAWRNCDEFVKAFAECSKTSGYGVFYKCRAQSKAMKSCISNFQQPEFVDVERDLYIKRKMEKLEKEKNAQIEQESGRKWFSWFRK